MLQIDIMPADIQARYGDNDGSSALVVEDKGIRLRSTLPVTVYVHSVAISESMSTSADSYTILPTALLGQEYFAFGTVYHIDYPNVIMAVAIEDNTTV